jgi:hypothetical protein
VVVATPAEVREKFRRVKPFGEITAGRRCCAAPILGQSDSSAPPCWTLDVLNIVRRLVESRRRGDESQIENQGKHETPHVVSYQRIYE